MKCLHDTRRHRRCNRSVRASAPDARDAAAGLRWSSGVATISRSSGRPVATGLTPDGRLIFVVYEQIDESTVYPVTAYDVED